MKRVRIVAVVVLVASVAAGALVFVRQRAMEADVRSAAKRFAARVDQIGRDVDAALTKAAGDPASFAALSHTIAKQLEVLGGSHVLGDVANADAESCSLLEAAEAERAFLESLGDVLARPAADVDDDATKKVTQAWSRATAAFTELEKVASARVTTSGRVTSSLPRFLETLETQAEISRDAARRRLGARFRRRELADDLRGSCGNPRPLHRRARRPRGAGQRQARHRYLRRHRCPRRPR